jgi:hypothetical protein
MLYNLGLTTADRRYSGPDIPDLLWCASLNLRRTSCLISSCFLFFAVLSIISVVESSIPGTNILNGKPGRFMVVWVSLSVGSNVIVTSMICFRLLQMRALMREVLSPELSIMYTNIAAILIESAAPLSIVGIGFVVTAAQKGPLMFAFFDVWIMLCVESKFSLLTFVIAQRESLTELSSSLPGTLPANDHPSGCYGQWASQRDCERDQH